MVKQVLVSNSKFVLFTLTAAWAIGIGLRMLIATLSSTDVIYYKNSFDPFFDWTILVLLGCLLLVYSVYAFIIKNNKEGVYAKKN